VTEALCRDQALWLRQQTLLCDEDEIGEVADAFENVYAHRSELV
jgi:hypothetical protein